MIRVVLLLILGVAAFFGSLAAALAFTGNLNAESIERILRREPPPAAAPPDPAEDPLTPLARQLRAKEAALVKREQELRERESRLEARMRELQQLQGELDAMHQLIAGALDESDTERTVRIQTVATTVAQMKPDRAAEALLGLPDEDAAEILREVRDRDRGKIVDAMDPARAARVLQALQEPPL